MDGEGSRFVTASLSPSNVVCLSLCGPLASCSYYRIHSLVSFSRKCVSSSCEEEQSQKQPMLPSWWCHSLVYFFFLSCLKWKGSISSGEGNGYPLQYSFLGNSMDREVWWATVHGIARVRHNWVTNTHFKVWGKLTLATLLWQNRNLCLIFELLIPFLKDIQKIYIKIWNCFHT